MGTKTTKNKAKNTQRVEGEWNAAVRTHFHRDIGRLERKVLTTGIVSIPIDDIMPRIVGAMLQGQEVRLTNGGEDMIRLFPCLDRSLTTMGATAQAMGAFGKSLACVKFHLARTDGKSASELKRVASEMKAEYQRRKNVTPDTVVKCPNCGTEFRVGKQLV